MIVLIMNIRVHKQFATCALLCTLLAHFVQSTARSTAMQFPKCANVTQKCASVGCTELPNLFEYNGDHSKNLLCINQTNNSLPVIRPPYRLRGCPTEFYNTYQSTSGVCSVRTDDNGTDLLLTVNEMAPGLHSFSCVVPEAPSGTVSSYAVIVREHSVYRDFRILINGVLQYYHNSTNVTLDVGSNLTVVVLAVGNVSVINVSDSRFVCVTDLACKHNPDGLSSRYQKCSLRTPAELSDDGRTLLFSIDNTETMRFSIAVNKTSPAIDEGDDDEDDEGGSNGASSDLPSALTYVIATIVLLAVVVLLIIVILIFRQKRHSQDAMKNVEEAIAHKSSAVAGEGGNERSNEGGNERSNEGGNERSNEGGNERSNEGGNERSNEGGNERSNEGGNEGSNEGGNEGSNEGGNEEDNSGGNSGGNSRGNSGASYIAICADMDAASDELDQFRKPDKVYTKPLLRDLYQYITPRYGAYWEVIGELLGLQTGALRIIEAEWPTNIERCCNKMLNKWLDIDITASWQKMFAAIESPAVRCFDLRRGMFTLPTTELNQLCAAHGRGAAVVGTE